jgi:hypothetical protein
MSAQKRAEKAARAAKKAEATAEVAEEQMGGVSEATAPKRAAKPKPEPRPCVCGCSGVTKGGLFVSGHDGRVHGWFAMVKEGAMLAAGLRTPELQAAFARWDGNGGLKAAFGEGT